MKLYYCSLDIVKKPEIRKSNRYLDFGQGFYTTFNKMQAISWALKHKKQSNVEKCYVSVYDFNLDCAKKELKIITFDNPSKEWLDFVVTNRKGEYNEYYDLAIGPVADDGVYEVVRFYENGFYDLNEALNKLKIVKHYNQVLFHTEKSLQFLKYLNMEELQ